MDRFVKLVGGSRISDLLGKSPPIENADYYVETLGIVLELKECTTDFAEAAEFQEKHFDLAKKHIGSDAMTFRQALGVDRLSEDYVREFLGLFRPPLGRILKKANRQIRSTKEHFKWTSAHGILLFVNDGFRSLEPHFVRALIANLLTSSYSSIECCVYMTINTYVEFPGSDYAHLLWVPAYSDQAPDTLVTTVNTLGAQWSVFLETLIGPWDISTKTDNPDVLRGSKAIRPNEAG